MKPVIEIRTGSDSDIPKIKEAYAFLEAIEVPFTPRILSAHRTPKEMIQQAQALAEEGFRVSIAAAGGAAHLPGMTASETLVPVVGLPVIGSTLDGLDSLLSIIQMPNGIPVGTVDAGEAQAAAVLAAQIAYGKEPAVRNRVRAYFAFEDTLPSTLPDDLVVGVVKQTGTYVDRAEYVKMCSLLGELGVHYTEQEFTERDTKSLMAYAKDMELAGSIALIALTDVTAAKPHFPRELSLQTDIPVIGLGTASFLGCDLVDQEGLVDMLNDSEDTNIYTVAGMGINRFSNAALYAAQIVGLHDPTVRENVGEYRKALAASVQLKNQKLTEKGITAFI